MMINLDFKMHFFGLFQGRKLPYSIKIVLMIIGFMMILPVVSAETVKLLENTDICKYIPDMDLDYCFSKYEICDLSIIDVQKSTFLFKDESSGYANDLKSIYSKNVSIKDKGMCKELTISAYKSPFRNVDNVLCTPKKCYYEYVWWNASFTSKYPVNASTSSGEVTLLVLLNDSAVIINNIPQYIWCNYTVNTTRRAVGYLYFTNESFYRCVDETETFSVSMFIDEGNETNFGSLENSLEAWWTMNGSLLDMTSNDNDLTNTGTDLVNDGKIGNARYFNATQADYLNTTSTMALNWSGGLTACTWFKYETAGSYVLVDYQGTNTNFLFYTTGAGQNHCPIMHIYTPGIKSVYCTDNVNDNNWHLGCGVWNTTDMFMYIDGHLGAGADAHVLQSGTAAIATTTARIGYDKNDTSAFDGYIDNIMLWNRSLSADEITAMYNNTIGTHNFAPLGPVEIFAPNTALLAINRELSDFIFSDSDFIDTNIINFNTSSPNTTFLILSSMNIEKLVPGGTNVITVRIILDSNETLIEEDLRTVTGASDIGSSGTSPVIFSVSSGEHNITYQFKRSGPGDINISNFDFNMIQFISSDGNNVRNQLLLTDFNHADTSFTTAFNWTMNKTINSTAFILVRNTLKKSGTGSTTATYFFENLETNDTSPFWQRFISDSSDIGSVSGIYIDPTEIGEHNHSIRSRQTDIGDVVFVNGSLVDFDLVDSDGLVIPFFQVSNESTNLTDSITLAAGIHLLVESTVLNNIGNSYFISFFSSFTTTTGVQTPRYFIDSPNLTSTQCFTEKLRTLSDNNDIGNSFAYTICDGLTNASYTFRLWVEVETGESLTQLDESLLGFETVNFSITEGQVAPIASAITNPSNGSNVSGFDVITWLPFFDPNDDLVTYNVTLVNPDGTFNISIGLTNSTSLSVNWNSFGPGIFFLQVEGCDPGNLCSDTNISIRIIAEPLPELRPSITFCEDSGILRTESNIRTIINGNITDEIEITRNTCIYGCSNWTLITFGNPGCEEGPYILSIIFIVFLILIILIIRGAVK